MSRPRASRAATWIAVLAAPPIAALALAAFDAATRPAIDADAARAAVERALSAFDARVGEATARALDRPLAEAVAQLPLDLVARLEGVAVYEGSRPQPVEWFGTPLDAPTAALASETGRSAAIRLGRVIRWVTLSSPDSAGRRAFATFVLDDGRGDLAIAGLLPRSAARVLEIRVESSLEATAAPSRGIVLRDLHGAATAVIRVTAEPRRAAGGPRSPRALAAAGLALAAALASWGLRLGSTPSARTRATLGAVALFFAARASLLAAHAPAALMPPELGGASIAGAGGILGLLSSPADVLLTALGALATARILVAALAPDHDSPKRRAAAILALVGAALTGCAIAASWIVASNSRIRLPGLAGEAVAPAIGVMTAGLGILVLAASVPWGGLAGLRRPGGSTRRRVTFLATVPIAALAGVAAHRAYDQVAIGRLQAEFAPQIVEQRATRELALSAALDDAATAMRSLSVPSSATRESLNATAHDLWLRSDLFHSGLKSSITLFDPAGNPVGHFGFDLPSLDERCDPTALPEAPPAEVFEEPFLPIETVRKRLLHAALAVRAPDGTLRGAVVAHVLDEPDNLSFLPASRTYLAALGGHPPDPWGAQPEYVAYDPYGVAAYHTLPRPPAWTYAFDKAAIEGRVVRVQAGGFRYHALPVVETRRLHLLLVPAATILDYLGTLVRLAAIAAILFALLEVVSGRLATGAAAESAAPRRRSYYRKLAAALVAASVVPWLGLSILVQRDIERRGRDLQEDAAEQIATVARRVVEDYQNSLSTDDEAEFPDDALLYWLRRLVGQDIHLYGDGVLIATSKRELLDAGLLPLRLASDVDFAINQGNRPSLVRAERYGGVELPVAYAPVSFGDGARRLVVAVPLVLAVPEIPRAIARNVELILLSTAVLAAFLAIAAAPMARTVARPIRDLAAAAERVAAGDYDARLASTSQDEIGELVRSFDAMVGALKSQRADLERRRDYMEALLRNATLGVLSTDASGRVVTANPAASALLGDPVSGLPAGTSLDDALAHRPDVGALRVALISAGAEPVEVGIERSGAARRLRTVRVPLPDPEGGPAGTLILLEDVTDLMRRNQLEAWAEMARAIAHEVKNPLTPIQLSTEHVERVLRDRGLLPDNEIETCLRTIVKQVRALRDIAAEFSAYSKVPALEPVPADPSEILREAIAPYRHAPPAGIAVLERYERCPAVRVDRRVLARAIVNLVENAIQAMPEGGTLSVSTSSHDVGRWARLTIADTGSGLAPEARARLFEPYFSTKSAGTGLGLAIARRAVEAHHGRIEVESGDVGGTAFHIVLPAVVEDAHESA